MAGLFDILQSSETGDKLPIHAFDAALAEFVRGKIDGARAHSYLESQLRRQFTQAEVDDLNAIVTQMNGKANTTGKLAYNQGIMGAFQLAENGEYTEAEWRSSLGIS